jgi:hypothetical protein
MRLSISIKFSLVFFLFVSFSIYLNAQESEFEKDIMAMFSDSGKDIWIHNYNGKINNIHQVKLGLGFDGVTYKGIYQYQSSGAYFFLEGKFNGDILELQEIDKDDYTTGYLLLKKGKNIWRGEWRNLDKTLSFPVTFQHEAISKMLNTNDENENEKERYFEYADFDFRIEWMYPAIQNASFNKWISDKIHFWKRDIKNEIQTLKKNNDGISARDRFRYEAMAWTEIACKTNDIVSGKFLIQNNWNPEVMVQTFHYDLEKNNEFDIQSLFKQEIKDNESVTKAIDTQIATLPLDEKELMGTWLTPESYKYYILGEKGLIVSTGFNTIFGSKQIVIPYSELKEISRRSSVLRSLIN